MTERYRERYRSGIGRDAEAGNSVCDSDESIRRISDSLAAEKDPNVVYSDGLMDCNKDGWPLLWPSALDRDNAENEPPRGQSAGQPSTSTEQ